MRMKEHRCNLEIGVVQIVSGPFEGQLAYFDDTDREYGREKRTKAVVYFGTPFASEPVLMSTRHLRSATPDQKIEYEMRYLAAMDTELREEMGV